MAMRMARSQMETFDLLEKIIRNIVGKVEASLLLYPARKRHQLSSFAIEMEMKPCIHSENVDPALSGS